MALTNIAYGSLASSETMNNNFSYLDNKISSTSESISTSISSISSNIATINSRLNELSDDVDDSLDTLDSKIEGYKTKLKLLNTKSTIVPNWAGGIELELTANVSYSAPSNGFLLVTSGSTAGNIVISSISIPIKSNQTVTIPVLKNDSAVLSMTPASSYFLPAAEISVENL